MSAPKPLPLPPPEGPAPWETGQFAPEQEIPSDEIEKALRAHKGGLSAAQLAEYEREIRYIDARRRALEAQIKGEIQEAMPLSAKFPSPQTLVEWLKPIRKEAQEAKGASRRIRVWLNWVPETGEVLLRREPLFSALRVSGMIGPNTSLPPVASSLLEALERDSKAMIKRYGLKGTQERLLRRTAAPKLGRMPSECTKAMPSLEEVADMVTRFRRDKLTLSDPLEEGQYVKIMRKEQRDERFVQGVTVYGLYRPETGQLRLVTSLMLEKFREHAKSLGHWPFLVCQATWRKYQNARQVAGFLRRDLCRVYQAYLDLCRKEILETGAQIEEVEIDGLRVPSVAVPVTQVGPFRRGKVAFGDKVYNTVEEQEYYDSSKSNTEGVILPGNRKDQRRRIKP